MKTKYSAATVTELMKLARDLKMDIKSLKRHELLDGKVTHLLADEIKALFQLTAEQNIGWTVADALKHIWETAKIQEGPAFEEIGLSKRNREMSFLLAFRSMALMKKLKFALSETRFV